jgi:hypothetical protein
LGLAGYALRTVVALQTSLARAEALAEERKTEMDRRFEESSSDTDRRFRETREETDRRVGELRAEQTRQYADLRTEISRVHDGIAALHKRLDHAVDK